MSPSGNPRRIPMTVTFLEMTAKPAALPPPLPRGKIAFLKSENPPVHFYRYLYDTVGEKYFWVDRKKLPDDQLAEIIHAPSNLLYVLYTEGTPAGMAELDLRADGTANIAYFGLMPEATGSGWAISSSTSPASAPGRSRSPSCWSTPAPWTIPAPCRSISAWAFGPMRGKSVSWNCPERRIAGKVVPVQSQGAHDSRRQGTDLARRGPGRVADPAFHRRQYLSGTEGRPHLCHLASRRRDLHGVAGPVFRLQHPREQYRPDRLFLGRGDGLHHLRPARPGDRGLVDGLSVLDLFSAVCVAGGVLGVLFTIPLAARAGDAIPTCPIPKAWRAPKCCASGADMRAEGNPGSARRPAGGRLWHAGVGGACPSPPPCGWPPTRPPVSSAWARGASGYSISFSLALLGAGHLVGISVGLAMAAGHCHRLGRRGAPDHRDDADHGDALGDLRHQRLAHPGAIHRRRRHVGGGDLVPGPHHGAHLWAASKKCWPNGERAQGEGDQTDRDISFPTGFVALARSRRRCHACLVWRFASDAGLGAVALSDRAASRSPSCCCSVSSWRRSAATWPG